MALVNSEWNCNYLHFFRPISPQLPKPKVGPRRCLRPNSSMRSSMSHWAPLLAMFLRWTGWETCFLEKEVLWGSRGTSRGRQNNTRKKVWGSAFMFKKIQFIVVGKRLAACHWILIWAFRLQQKLKPTFQLALLFRQGRWRQVSSALRHCWSK